MSEEALEAEALSLLPLPVLLEDGSAGATEEPEVEAVREGVALRRRRRVLPLMTSRSCLENEGAGEDVAEGGGATATVSVAEGEIEVEVAGAAADVGEELSCWGSEDDVCVLWVLLLATLLPFALLPASLRLLLLSSSLFLSLLAF